MLNYHLLIYPNGKVLLFSVVIRVKNGRIREMTEQPVPMSDDEVEWWVLWYLCKALATEYETSVYIGVPNYLMILLLTLGVSLFVSKTQVRIRR